MYSCWFGKIFIRSRSYIIVGGNIAHATRVMTTTIALETSKGNLEIAVALGFILIFISIFINLLVSILTEFAKRVSYD